MSRRQRRFGMALTVLLVLAGRAAADPVTTIVAPAITGASHINTSSHLVTDGGSDLRLPAGYFLDEPSYTKIDTELKRLQDSETGLQAANNSLRQSMSGWSPGWKTLLGTLVSGLLLGMYVEHRL